MQHRLVLSALVLALAAPLALAQPSTWNIDPQHSSVGFTVKHMSISNVRGRFGKTSGVIVYNQADLAKSSVKVAIDLAGVDTSEPARDAHLKTADFFDVAQYPTATFTSTSVSGGGGHLKVAGLLNLHGVVKPVVLEVEGPEPPVPGADKKLHTGFTATALVHRSDFGLGAKFPNAMVSEDVKLSIDVEAVLQ